MDWASLSRTNFKSFPRTSSVITIITSSTQTFLSFSASPPSDALTKRETRGKKNILHGLIYRWGTFGDKGGPGQISNYTCGHKMDLQDSCSKQALLNAWLRNNGDAT